MNIYLSNIEHYPSRSLYVSYASSSVMMLTIFDSCSALVKSILEEILFDLLGFLFFKGDLV